LSLYLISSICAAVRVAAALLHCDPGDLITALSTRRIRAGGDDIVQQLTLSQVFVPVI
jgi:myosin-5